MSRRLGMPAVACALTLGIAGAAAGCGGSSTDKAGGRGPAGTSQTLKLHSGRARGGYFALETKHKPPGAPWAGYTKTYSVADSSGTVGSQDTVCVAGALAGRSNCNVTLTLERGTIVGEGVFTAGGGYSGTLAVTGGTGAYEGARGTYRITAPGPDPQLIVVHLLLP
ncbi:MAG: hypothetical protein ACJ76Z_13760 [Thermoleophilaceae bacterium]